VVIGYNDHPLLYDIYIMGFFGLLMLAMAVLAFSERE